MKGQNYAKAIAKSFKWCYIAEDFMPGGCDHEKCIGMTAVEKYVEAIYGERCKTKDTHDFPKLEGDPLANRCLTCQAWEDFDEYFKDKDEKENTL